jgi:hypothetical protein
MRVITNLSRQKTQHTIEVQQQSYADAQVHTKPKHVQV